MNDGTPERTCATLRGDAECCTCSTALADPAGSQGSVPVAALQRRCPRWYGWAIWAITLTGLVVTAVLVAAWSGWVYFQCSTSVSWMIETWRQQGRIYIGDRWFSNPHQIFEFGRFCLYGAAVPAVILAAGLALRRFVAMGREAFWLVGVLALALAVRLWFVLSVPFEPWADFVVYHNAGVIMSKQWILAVNDYAVYRCFFPPGQVFTLGVLYRLFDVRDLAPQIFNCVYATATVAGIWYLARRWFGPVAGRLTGLIGAMLPSSIFGCLLLGAEVPQTFWFVLALCLLVRCMDSRRRWAWALAAGASLGIASLIRPTFVLVPIVIGLHLLLSWKGNRRRALLVGVTVGLGVAAVVLPWTLRNYRVTGGFLLISSNGGGNLYSANNDRAEGAWTQWAWDQVYRNSHDDLSLNRVGAEFGKKWIREHPREFSILAIKKLVMFWETDKEIAWWATEWSVRNARDEQEERERSCFSAFTMAASDGYYFILLLAGAIGLVRFRRQLAADHGWMIFPCIAAYFTAIHMVFESQGKYHYSLVPPLAIFAALAVAPRRSRPATLSSPK